MDQQEHRPRRARPQLFGASNADRHGEFRESILATIDGGSTSPDATRRSLVARGSLALGLVVCVGIGLIVYRSLSVVAPTPVAAEDTEAPKQPTREIALPEGRASVIDSTPIPPIGKSEMGMPAPSFELAATTPNASLPTEPAAPGSKTGGDQDKRATKRSAVLAREGAKVAAPKKPANEKINQRDPDVEVVAAMLPYLNAPKRPESPGLEQRCGALSGGAASTCRAKFCNGREGSDPACPSALLDDRTRVQ